MFEIPKGYERYCKPTDFCESESKEIRKFAREIAAEKKDPLEVVKSFYLWVRDKVGWNLVPVVECFDIVYLNRGGS